MNALTAARQAWLHARHTNAISHPLYDDAAKATSTTAEGAPLPLQGWPAVVKDLIDVAGAPCAVGMDAFAGRIAATDAALVSRLRAAGALVVGVAASDSAGFGVTTPAVRHPLWDGHTVGGSSGGSAAAVLAGMARIALGTDTGGSCRIPAACCGIAGFKPTRGALPMDGILPLAPSLDHVGLLAATAHDIGLAFAALTEGVPVSPPSQPPARIGFETGMLDECAPAQRRGVEGVIDLLRAAGAEIRPVQLPGRGMYQAVHADIFCYEAVAAHEALCPDWRTLYPDNVRRILAFGSRMAREDYDRAIGQSRALAAEAAAMFDAIDILVTPTLGVPVPRQGIRKIDYAGEETDVTAALLRFTVPFNHTGQPALSIPAANATGPHDAASVQIVGPRGDDEQVLAAGLWLEGVREKS